MIIQSCSEKRKGYECMKFGYHTGVHIEMWMEIKDRIEEVEEKG